MAQQDLSYVFQPVIHEPLSRPDVSTLSPTEYTVDPNMENVTEGSDASSEPLSPISMLDNEKDALGNIEDADKCKIDHPRKAMSLYLKAGKALVLCNQADTALKCFRSLVLLATDQLAKVLHEKQKLAKVRRSGSSTRETEKKDKKKITRTKSFDIPSKRVDLLTLNGPSRNCKSVSESPRSVTVQTCEETVAQTVDVVEEVAPEIHCEFVAVEEIQTVEENTDNEIVINCDCQEMLMPEEVSLCEPVMEYGLQEEMPVFSVTEVTECMTGTEEMTMACETDNVCEVSCFETEASLDFEVAMVESLDDSASTHSSLSTEDIVKTLNAEIVMMECEEVMVSAEEVPADPQQNAYIRRGYVVSELIDTEQNYVRDLGDVIKGYMAALSKESNVPSELKGKEKLIFSNIQDIHTWHSSTFFKNLKVCEDDPSKLGEVFTLAESKMEELYTIYCRTKPKSDLYVLPHKDTFFKDCRKRLGHRLQLPDYLIKPVQRITKYQLLLRDILKFTERAGEDGSEIQKAIDVALRILKRTNDMIAVAMIQGYDAKPEETGGLLLRENLEIAEGKYRQKVKERAVFLFERLILVTDSVEMEGGMSELRFQSTIKTHGLGLTETVDSDPCKWAAWLRKRGNAEIYVFKAPSIEIKEIWMRNIRQCSIKKKAPGLLKSLYRSRTFRREESETKEIIDALSPTFDDAPSKQESTRKSSKRKTSKGISRKKKSRDSGISDKLKESIMKFRAEEQMMSVEEATEVTYAEPPNSLSTLSPDSALPQSPGPVDTALEQVSFIEQRAKIEAEENQLNKVLMLTRLIAARLLQTKDASESLELYGDVIASVLPIGKLRHHQEAFAARDSLLEHCTDIYENWRRENLFESSDIEERYTSMTSLLSETAGFCSLHKGNTWSVVLYSVCAMAGGREQKWRDASQAFYRLSLVYSALEATSSAVESLVDAHWMSCQAGDYQGAGNFFYNAFIRALACRDLMRCLRFEQQGLFLIERLTKDGNNNCNEDMIADNESRGFVSPQHLSFLVNMSRATRRKDWAWFEFAESELTLITSNSSGRQADAILSAVFQKLKRFIGESMSS